MRFAAIKRAISIISLLVLLVTACGCSSGGNINPSDLSESLVAQTEFAEMKQLSGAAISSYFGFKDSDVKRFSVAVSAKGESADTVACFEITDTEQQSTVVTGISQYLTKLSTSFKATMESEYYKVQNRVLVKLDDMVVLVICSDHKTMGNYLTDLGAKEIF